MKEHMRFSHQSSLNHENLQGGKTLIQIQSIPQKTLTESDEEKTDPVGVYNLDLKTSQNKKQFSGQSSWRDKPLILMRKKLKST